MRRTWLYAGLIVLAGVLAYANSLSGPFVLDDDVAIVTNDLIRELWPLSKVLVTGPESPVSGRPIANLSFALNYAMGGLDVLGYHAWNIAIHLLAALVLFGIVRRTLGLPGVPSRFADRSAALALASALIWTVHPLQTESVSYVTQRTESLMGLFFLLTLYAGIRAARARRAGTWELVSVAACFLGMGSKESMVTAPLMVVLYDRVFLFDSFTQVLRARRRLYAGLAASWVLLAVLVSANPRPRSAGFSSGASPWTYLLNQSVMIVEYLRLVVWPRALVLDYGMTPEVTLGDVLPYAIAITLLLALTIAALIVRPMLGFLGAWFFATLAPTSSLLPITTEVGAERRMYLPLAAVAVLAVLAGYLLWDRFGRAATKRLGVPARVASAGGIAALVAVLAALAAGTILRNREYASGVSLARTIVERRPHGRAHHLLAAELIKAGEREESLVHLRQAIPGDPRARFSLGLELFDEGRFDEAIEQLREFIRLEPDVDKAIPAQDTVGLALARQGRHAEALKEFRRTLERAPWYVDAHGHLGDALLALQQPDEAIIHYRTFLEQRPGDFNAVTNLGIALAATGKIDDAVQSFRRAADIDPRNADAHRNLAKALLDQGDVEAAARHAEYALTLRADDAGARTLLGVALMSLRQFEQAAAQFRQVLQADPTNTEAQDHLKFALRLKDEAGGAR